MNDSWKWLAPLSGIVFIVLLFVGFALAGEPPTLEDDGVAEVIQHYSDNKDEIFIAGALSGIAAAFLLIYGGYLRKVLSDAEGEQGFLSAVSFAGVILIVVGVTIDGTVNIALSETVDDVEPSAVQALAALWENDFVPVAAGVLTFLISTGISIVRHGALPKWLGWAAIVCGVCTISPLFFVGLIGAVLLVAISSVMLAMRARSAS